MKPSTRTNAMREVLRFVALTLDDWADTAAVHQEIGNPPDSTEMELRVTPAREHALRSLAKELRGRASGHRGRSA